MLSTTSLVLHPKKYLSTTIAIIPYSVAAQVMLKVCSAERTNQRTRCNANDSSTSALAPTMQPTLQTAGVI
jgi:hypothetical protein